MTRKELEYMMGEVEDQYWKDVLTECDHNKDGKVLLKLENN